MLQNGEWPYFEGPEPDAERDASARHNMEVLVGILRAIGEETVELYGIWDGNASETPLVRENVSDEALLDARFHFKEGGFYRVSLQSKPERRRWPTQE